MRVSTHVCDRPLIGIAPRWQVKKQASPFDERLSPEEAIASVFMDAIIAAGGMPFVIPLTKDDALIDRYISLCDGFAIPGGPDVSPRCWGVNADYNPELLCPMRDAFELSLVKRILEVDKPLFTTCRGTQLLNVALGGTLCMDVPSLPAPEGMTQWRHTGILNSAAHPVEVAEGSLLRRAVGGAALVQANSSHHCCVDVLGEGVVLSGRATDGVPEAIEVPGRRFVLGVQWHPEYTWERLDSDFNLWKAFVQAC